MAEAEAEVDRSLIKIIVLGIVAVIAAGFFGYRMSLFRPEMMGEMAVITLIAGLAWLILLLLQVFLVKSSLIAWQLFLAQAIAIALPFYRTFSLYLITGTLLLLFSLAWGFSLGRSDLVHYVKIKFFRIGMRILPPFLTGIAFFVTIVSIGMLNSDTLTVPRGLFDSVLEGTLPFTERFIPGIRADATIDEVLQSFARRQLGGGVSAEVIAGRARDLREALSRGTGVAINSDSLLKDVLYQITVSKLSTLTSTAKVLGLLVIGLFIFGAVKGLAFFFGWIVLLFAFLFYRLLLMANLFYIGLETQQKEVIVMK